MGSEQMVADNLKFYDTIKPKILPNSYTVLATLNDYNSGKLLALATGTQASLRRFADDIEDCHAESLLKRAFKRHQIDTINRLVSNHKEQERGGGGEELNDVIAQHCNLELTLFISQFPCGLVRRYEGCEPLDEQTGRPMELRKPGRGCERDGKTVYVQRADCLTKLKRWQLAGWQGSRLKAAFDIQSRLRRVVVGDCEPDASLDYGHYARKLADQVGGGGGGGGGASCSDGDGCDDQRLVVETLRLDRWYREQFKFGPLKQPQPVSLACWAGPADLSGGADSGWRHELIVEGRRRGLTNKQCAGGLAAGLQLQLTGASLRRDTAKCVETAMHRSQCPRRAADDASRMGNR